MIRAPCPDAVNTAVFGVPKVALDVRTILLGTYGGGTKKKSPEGPELVV